MYDRVLMSPCCAEGFTQQASQTLNSRHYCNVLDYLSHWQDLHLEIVGILNRIFDADPYLQSYYFRLEMNVQMLRWSIRLFCFRWTCDVSGNKLTAVSSDHTNVLWM